MEPNEKIQNHGMTHSQMEDLRYKQEHGGVEMVKANNAGDNIGDEIFAELYSDHQIPAHETGIYHVAAEPRTWSNNGAKPVRTSVAVVHKFTPQAWEFQKKNNAFAGQVVHILHNPELEAAKNRKEKEAIKAAQVPGAVPEETQVDNPDNVLGNPNTQGTQPLQNQTVASTEQPEDLEALTVPELKEYYEEVSGESAPSGIVKADLIKEIKKAKKKK